MITDNMRKFIKRWEEERGWTRRWTIRPGIEFLGKTQLERAQKACDNMVTPIQLSANEIAAIDELISYFKFNAGDK